MGKKCVQVHLNQYIRHYSCHLKRQDSRLCADLTEAEELSFVCFINISLAGLAIRDILTPPRQQL